MRADLHQFFFVSGLPRAGSTLLCNLLAQHPSIHATPTCGLLDVLFGVRNQWRQLIEYKANPQTGNQQGAMRGLFHGYFSHVDKPIVAVKSRGWVEYIEMTEWVLGRKIKILVPIRHLPDVLASFEKLYRRTSKDRQPPLEAQDYFRMQHVAGRCEAWMSASQPIGLAYHRIRDALQRGYGDRLHFVRFEELTTQPQRVLNGIYEFLGYEPYEHDFDHVEQVTSEDDEVYGFAPDLHTIQTKVTPKPSDAAEVLGAEVVKKYAGGSF